MLDSLVRVSRRAEWTHYVNILSELEDCHLSQPTQQRAHAKRSPSSRQPRKQLNPARAPRAGKNLSRTCDQKRQAVTETQYKTDTSYLPANLLSHIATDADTLAPKVHPSLTETPLSRTVSRIATASTISKRLILIQAMIGCIRFHFNNFKHFLLSFQSSFHLSFTLLVRYRSPANI